MNHRQTLLLSCLALSLVAAAVRGEEEPLKRMRVDGVAAYVNKHVITLSDVLVLIEPVRQQLGATYTGAALQERLRTAFDSTLATLIDRFLVLDAYEKQGGRLPDWAIEQRVEEMIKELFNGDRAALMQALSKEQMTYDEWRDTIKRQMVVQSMRQANVDQYVKIAPGRVRAYYDGHADEFQLPAHMHVRMLVVTAEKVPDHEQRKRQAEELVQRGRDGADFAALATQFSGGSHAAEGGDWGWIDPTHELRSELARVAEATETGQVSDPVKIADALYIIKVEGRREADVAPFDDVYSQIERALRQKEIQSSYAIWLARLKGDAFVKIVPTESI
ncbi:MAG: peptidyl-prolyl cis-trans isomerase [Lentisphaerae bacterium]|nr:peptidyl-prolyl cis-trans isomerase [Lentisphaerota bacterium]